MVRRFSTGRPHLSWSQDGFVPICFREKVQGPTIRFPLHTISKTVSSYRCKRGIIFGKFALEYTKYDSVYDGATARHQKTGLRTATLKASQQTRPKMTEHKFQSEVAAAA